MDTAGGPPLTWDQQSLGASIEESVGAGQVQVTQRTIVYRWGKILQQS